MDLWLEDMVPLHVLRRPNEEGCLWFVEGLAFRGLGFRVNLILHPKP